MHPIICLNVKHSRTPNRKRVHRERQHVVPLSNSSLVQVFSLVLSCRPHTLQQGRGGRGGERERERGGERDNGLTCG